MIKNPIWAHVPLMWAKTPNQWLQGKKLKQLIEAYQHRSIELSVSHESEIHWRRFIHDECLELGL